MQESKLLSREDAAAYLGISVRTLDRLRAEGKMSFVRLGGRVSYLPSDLDAYVERNRVEAARPRTLEKSETWRRRRAAG